MSGRGGAWVVGSLVAVVLSACAPPGDSASDTARDFYAAVAAGDGDAACAALAPLVADAVEDAEQAPCADALTTGDLGEDLLSRAGGAGDPRVRVAGRQAQVRLGADTMFLARSGDGWVVTAAGCTARPERPYDCEVAE